VFVALVIRHAKRMGPI